jgi:hypothetical protein
MAVHGEGRGFAVGVLGAVAVGTGCGARASLEPANNRLAAGIFSGVGRTLTVTGGEI